MSGYQVSAAILAALTTETEPAAPAHDTHRENNGSDLIRVVCSCGYKSRWVSDMTSYITTRDRHVGRGK